MIYQNDHLDEFYSVTALKFDFEVKMATSYQNQNSIPFFHKFYFFEKLGQNKEKPRQ